MPTEAEAKQMWCPQARVVVGEMGRPFQAAGNRLPGLGSGHDPDLDWPSPRCIASQCMWWRWGLSDDGPHTNGFCGAAGKP